MNDKIAWFEELLALEPNSKLFISLARAYVQKERTEDAVKVLQKGISFHPEHLEARLLLIQCLAKVKDVDTAKSESRNLAEVLLGYPDFWDLWAELQTESANRDMALSLRLMAKFIKGEGINWGEVFEQGLRATVLAQEHPLAQPEKSADEKTPNAKDHTATIAGDPDTPKSLDMSDLVDEDDMDSPPSGGIQSRIPLPSPEEIPGYTRNMISVSPAMRKQPATDGSDALSSNELALSETERNYYETRTYAALLADQGEFQEALDLYNKLLRASDDAQQRRDLKGRIRAIKESLQKTQAQSDFRTSPATTRSKDEETVVPDSPSFDPALENAGPPELVQTLTRLAERLEARSQA